MIPSDQPRNVSCRKLLRKIPFPSTFFPQGPPFGLTPVAKRPETTAHAMKEAAISIGLVYSGKVWSTVVERAKAWQMDPCAGSGQGVVDMDQVRGDSSGMAVRWHEGSFSLAAEYC